MRRPARPTASSAPFRHKGRETRSFTANSGPRPPDYAAVRLRNHRSSMAASPRKRAVRSAASSSMPHFSSCQASSTRERSKACFAANPAAQQGDGQHRRAEQGRAERQAREPEIVQAERDGLHPRQGLRRLGLVDDAGGPDEPQALVRLHAIEDRAPEPCLALQKAFRLGGEVTEQVGGGVVGDRLGGGFPRLRHQFDGGVREPSGVHPGEVQVSRPARPIPRRPGRRGLASAGLPARPWVHAASRSSSSTVKPPFICATETAL